MDGEEPLYSEFSQETETPQTLPQDVCCSSALFQEVYLNTARCSEEHSQHRPQMLRGQRSEVRCPQWEPLQTSSPSRTPGEGMFLEPGDLPRLLSGKPLCPRMRGPQPSCYLQTSQQRVH